MWSDAGEELVFGRSSPSLRKTPNSIGAGLDKHLPGGDHSQREIEYT